MGDYKNTRPEFKLRNVTQLETLKFIKSLGNNMLYGHNKIDAMSIKLGAAILHRPICQIINLSLGTDRYIMRWKVAKVIPLWKGKGLSRVIPDSYRPISLLPTISKLTEKAVQFQLLNYMTKTRQLNTNHHYCGFHSTTTSLLPGSDAILEATDKKMVSVIMTINETAAFDTVCHDLLDKKLQLYNCSSSFRNWVASYLGQRTQYISIGGKQSRMKSVKMGVP